MLPSSSIVVLIIILLLAIASFGFVDDFNLEAARATQLFWDLIYGKYSSYILDADEDKIAVKAFVTIAGLQLVSYPSEVTAYSKFVQDFVNQARGILDVKIPQIGTGGKGKRRRKSAVPLTPVINRSAYTSQLEDIPMNYASLCAILDEEIRNVSANKAGKRKVNAAALGAGYWARIDETLRTFWSADFKRSMQKTGQGPAEWLLRYNEQFRNVTQKLKLLQSIEDFMKIAIKPDIVIPMLSSTAVSSYNRTAHGRSMSLEKANKFNIIGMNYSGAMTERHPGLIVNDGKASQGDLVVPHGSYYLLLSKTNSTENFRVMKNMAGVTYFSVFSQLRIY